MTSKYLEKVERFEQIVDGGYCIGCGGCSAASKGAVSVSMNELGMFQADTANASFLQQDVLDKVLYACPFSDDGPDEDSIGEELYAKECQYDEQLGFYKDLYVGHVSEGEFRSRGTSGGVITWILAELLKQDKIDAVVHVKQSTAYDDSVLFRYGISYNEDEVLSAAKSRYYPVEMSEVLDLIMKTPGRYAVVGLPCFIKSVRRLAMVEPIINERVAYCVGLVCGHLKSKAFSECFAWQEGIPPGQLQEIDFRVKLQEHPASHYGVYLRGNKKEITKPVRDFIGCNWGHNLFRYPACDYCDDVFAETADLVVGDAWLPEYEHDPKGTSIVVIRDKELSSLFKAAKGDGRGIFNETTLRRISQSQAGGLRDRREGLAYRLWLKKTMGYWVPKKRVEPKKNHLSRKRRKLYRLRSKIGNESHRVWAESVKKGSIDDFVLYFKKESEKYKRIYFTYNQRLMYKLRQLAKRVIKYKEL